MLLIDWTSHYLKYKSLQRSDLGHVSRAVVLGDNIVQLGLFLCMSGAVVGVGVILHLGFLPVR